MIFLNPFKKQSREQLMEKAISQILYIITRDEIIDFSHLEQSKILNELFVRYKDKKVKERTKAVKVAEEINESINELN